MEKNFILNFNSLTDLYIIRNVFRDKKVSLIFPAYNEEKNITHAIQDFNNIGVFDEILVVDNNSNDNTARFAKGKHVRVIKELKQGYGFALQRGLREAKGDYIVLCEPDNTFNANDTLRLLAYIHAYDMVAGTRTNTHYIQKGANMGFFLRIGNITVAKLLQFLYHTNSLTDCGCTLRVLRAPLVKKILPRLTVGASHFLAHLVVQTALVNGSILEIPVDYRTRVGVSKITGSFKKSVQVGLRMILAILKNRLKKPML